MFTALLATVYVLGATLTCNFYIRTTRVTREGSGNASQVSDRAAPVVLAQRLGLAILSKYPNSTTIGVVPCATSIGLAFAILRILVITGLNPLRYRLLRDHQGVCESGCDEC
ncbi:hypothetical protein BJ165DRAFT_1614225 [Panaeolus papilionaceus]|nr:hypothetical protein BJ165DRAFT_1614225 [Panaeolus papilionaceus]